MFYVIDYQHITYQLILGLANIERIGRYHNDKVIKHALLHLTCGIRDDVVDVPGQDLWFARIWMQSL
jgi:hypothetical protein